MGATSRRKFTLGASAAAAAEARTRATEIRIAWWGRPSPFVVCRASGRLTDDAKRSSVLLIRCDTGSPSTDFERNGARYDRFIAVIRFYASIDVQVVARRVGSLRRSHRKGARHRSVLGLHIDHANILGADHVHAHLHRRSDAAARR